mmetsp:Transcript_10162/g.19240  ORF Transcript_10162/g.19240 Transcript_10162/m.19240 type:complete len:152 (-) Transcript_10162:729-1184(-)
MPASACSLHSRIQRPVEFAASPRDRPGPCRRVRLAPWSKMYVPTDSFGGMSPEHVASNVLKKLHIHASVEVIGKLEASGAKCLEPGAHSTLTALLKRAPVTNADQYDPVRVVRSQAGKDIGPGKMLRRALGGSFSIHWLCKVLSLPHLHGL